MCLKNIINALFNKSSTKEQTGDNGNTVNPTTTTTSDTTPATLSLTHPEEAENTSQTVENVSIPDTLTKWLTDWIVPVEQWDYWRNRISVTVADDVEVAYSWESEGKRFIKVNPKWLNPGVIAHEQAHNSYSLLTPQQKNSFENEYTPLISTDPLIKYLYSINTYGLINVVEGHAEVYRYLGARMPGQLKKYYPKLF